MVHQEAGRFILECQPYDVVTHEYRQPVTSLSFFFPVSKILGTLLSPLLWICLLLLFAVIRRKRPSGRKLLLLSFILFFLFGNLFLAGEVMRLWEYPVMSGDPGKESYDVGILLGGGIVQEDKTNHRLIFRHNTDRLFQTMALYRSGKIKKILISAGSGELIRTQPPEGRMIRDYLLVMGIPAAGILLDSLSDNTHENAVESAKILAGLPPGSSCLLITSAFHMRRAAACFKKQGIHCDLYTTNKNTGSRRYTPDHLLLPSAGAFIFYHSLLHEMLGMLTYRIMGYA